MRALTLFNVCSISSPLGAWAAIISGESSKRVAAFHRIIAALSLCLPN